VDLRNRRLLQAQGNAEGLYTALKITVMYPRPLRDLFAPSRPLYAASPGLINHGQQLRMIEAVM